MPTIRQGIGAEAVERIATILTANDFETDAGANVFIGSTPELGKDDPDDAIAVVFGDDSVTHQQQKTYLTLPIEIQAVVKVGPSNAWLRLEAILGDIKRAMETADRRIAGYPMRRGTTRTLEREPGSTTAGVGVTYEMDYSEPWGQP